MSSSTASNWCAGITRSAFADGKRQGEVTLALDVEDVTRDDRIDVPKDGPDEVHGLAVCSVFDAPVDNVTVDGETVGVWTWIGYSANKGKMLTLRCSTASTRAREPK